MDVTSATRGNNALKVCSLCLRGTATKITIKILQEMVFIKYEFIFDSMKSFLR